MNDITTAIQTKQLPPLSVRKNLTWSLLAAASHAGSNWLLVIIFARIGGTELLGEYAIALAVVSPVFMLSSLQLRQLQATDFSNEFEFPDYFCVRLLSVATATITALIFAFFQTNNTAIIIVALTTNKAIEWTSDIIYGFFTKHQRIDLIAKSQFSRGLQAVALAAFFLYTTASALLSLLAVALSSLIMLLLYDLKKLYALAAEKNVACLPSWDYHRAINLLAVSLPLGIVIFLVSLNSNIPRYLVSELLGKKELGVFAGVYAVLNVAALPLNATLQPLSPRLAESYQHNDKKRFIKLTILSSACGASLWLVLCIATKAHGIDLLAFVLGPAFCHSSNLTTWLLIALGLQYISPFGVQLTAMKYRGPQLPAQALTTLATAIATLHCLQIFGLVGVAYGICIGNVARFFILGLLLVYGIRNRFH